MIKLMMQLQHTSLSLSLSLSPHAIDVLSSIAASRCTHLSELPACKLNILVLSRNLQQAIKLTQMLA